MYINIFIIKNIKKLSTQINNLTNLNTNYNQYLVFSFENYELEVLNKYDCEIVIADRFYTHISKFIIH